MGYDDFIAGLNPKVAKAIKTAQETETIKLPLASYGLTKALNGGIAKGRIFLLYGNTSSGKSLQMMQSIAKWQRDGLVCAYVDVEGTYDKAFAARLGVNNEELILIQSKSSGKIEDAIKPLLQNRIDAIVIDSISDIMPEVFIDKSGEMNDQSDRKQIGAQAKAITALINGIHYINEETAVTLISQTTTFMGQSYVEQVPHGGQKAQFASSQIVKLTSSAAENSQLTGKSYVGDHIFEIPVGRKVDYLVKKNKLGPAFTKGSYNMFYAGDKVGIDVIGEVITDAVRYELVTQGGAWFTYGDRKFQGMPSLVDFFREIPEEVELVKKRINEIETGEIV